VENKDYSSDGLWKFRLEPEYKYSPKEDITLKELAAIVALIANKAGGFEIEALPKNIKRHFQLIE